MYTLHTWTPFLASNLKIIQRNVQAIAGDNKKPSNWLSWFTRNKADIYVLIDTRASKDTELFLRVRWKGEIYVNTFSSNARGTAILVRNQAKIEKPKYKIIDKGKFSSLHFSFENKRFALNAIYGPNNDCPLYLKQTIFESDHNVRTEYVLYTGDWNVTIDPPIDNLNYDTICNPNARKVVKSRMESHGLVYLWRKNNPQTKN